MGKYKSYFVFHLIVLLLLIAVISVIIAHWDMDYLYYVTPILVVLGFAQLYVGLRLLTKFTDYPAWARKGIRAYWIMSAGYISLTALFDIFLFGPVAFVFIWLYILPWGIATYQVVLVYRLSFVRSKQLSERAFFQIIKCNV